METAADRVYEKIFPKENYFSDIHPVQHIHNIPIQSAVCVNGHQWTNAGEDLEGKICDCGTLRYHTETCPHCECKFTLHQKR